MDSCPIRRIITFKEAVVYGPVRVVDESKIDITTTCRWSWSTDGVCWTSWVPYDQYCKIATTLDTDYFLRILIDRGLGGVYYNGQLTPCYSICFEQSNVFLKEFCEDVNLFQPYQGLDCALLLQQQMADSIVCMFGIPIYYLRTAPDPESVDYTFKEWTLHNVMDVKQIKLMIQEGQMPSSNPRLTDFDFDWDIDWETELSKSQFAKAFGDNAFPKQRDLIYIPLMKRLWEVNSAYDEKQDGLLWRPTTWKLSLVKYNDKTNVDKGDFEDLIDTWMINRNNNDIEQNERESGLIHSPRFAATNLYNIFTEDAVRKQYTQGCMTVQDKLYCHHNNVTARNIYRFNAEEACVIYQNKICGDSGWLSFILETPVGINKNLDKEIIEFGELKIKIMSDNDGSMTLVWDGMSAPLNPSSVYMVIIKWDNKNKTEDMMVYPYTHPADKPIYLLRPDMYWWDFENPTTELTKEYNNDLSREGECLICGWPVALTNIKYYRGQMPTQDILKECIKYTTNHKQCIINDLARPINDGYGYSVK